MNKTEIRKFKSLLRQGSSRHMNMTLNDIFQKELLNIIKDYEKLQIENQELKKQLEVGEQQYNDLVEEKEKLFEEVNYTVIPNCDIKSVIDKYENQQKKFIKYLEDEISKQDKHIEELKKWQEIEENAPSNDFDLYIANVVKRDLEYVLSKYKEIIGVLNEKDM